MEQLLEELKQTDPACYDEIWAWALWLAEPDWGSYEPDDPGYLKHRDDVIQGACQRAIAVGGWEFRLGTALMDESVKGCYCAIMHRVSSMWMDLVVSREADSPAKVILSAYIAAKKACP